MAFTKPMHNSEIIVARTIKQGLNPILLVMSIEDFPKLIQASPFQRKAMREQCPIRMPFCKQGKLADKHNGPVCHGW